MVVVPGSLTSVPVLSGIPTLFRSASSGVGRPTSSTQETIRAKQARALRATPFAILPGGVEEPEPVVAATDERHGVRGRGAILFHVVHVGFGMPVEQGERRPGLSTVRAPLVNEVDECAAWIRAVGEPALGEGVQGAGSSLDNARGAKGVVSSRARGRHVKVRLRSLHAPRRACRKSQECHGQQVGGDLHCEFSMRQG